MTYRMAVIPLTLSDLEGQFCYLKKLSNSYSSGNVACNIYDVYSLIASFSKCNYM